MKYVASGGSSANCDIREDGGELRDNTQRWVIIYLSFILMALIYSPCVLIMCTFLSVNQMIHSVCQVKKTLGSHGTVPLRIVTDMQTKNKRHMQYNMCVMHLSHYNDIASVRQHMQNLAKMLMYVQ